MWHNTWGNDAATCRYAVMREGGDGCGEGTTQRVCSRPEGNTEQGLCDMAGNVREWVQDWFHSDYEGAPDDGSAWNDGSGSRVNRGGSFNKTAENLRAANRTQQVPTEERDTVGVRCAKDAP